VRTAAVVPINQLRSAKSRLARYLSESDRRELVYWMAAHVLTSLRRSHCVDHIALVSPDVEVLAWAEDRDVVPLYQESGGLNAGLELGRSWAHSVGAESLVVLLGDLPCLTPEEAARFIESGRLHPLVLAPDRMTEGTNGLLLHLEVQLPFAFGERSLVRHQELARERQITPLLFQAPGLSFDVDSYADLSMLYEFGIWMPGDHEQAQARAEPAPPPDLRGVSR
jgi:2-phospho-L-lactate/phosphoenolpyruvate guanylyltransferase